MEALRTEMEMTEEEGWGGASPLEGPLRVFASELAYPGGTVGRPDLNTISSWVPGPLCCRGS